jgi:hypothetical protein
MNPLTPLKCIATFVLSISLLLVATARSTSAQNLIMNGDFETGDFTGWTVTHAPSGSNISVGTTFGDPPDNTQVARFGATDIFFDTISQSFATTPGAFYTLSFFYQIGDTQSQAHNGFDVLWNGVSIGGGLFPQFDVNPGFGTFTFHLQATSALTTLEFDGRNAPFFDFLDDVSVTAAPCPQSQGYWKNNPDAWPVNSLTLGSQTYTKTELLTILMTATRGDASLILADQLIAAKLNIANGAGEPDPVPATITDADAVLSLYSGKLPYGVRPNTTNGERMVNDGAVLKNYNNGALTPGCTP